jgi:HSP20 family protein
MLTPKGDKHYAKDGQDKNRSISERTYGSFRRSFVLPDGVDRDKIAASLAKGMLMVTLPRTPETEKQQKKIEVKTAT